MRLIDGAGMEIRPATIDDMDQLLLVEDRCFGRERFDRSLLEGMLDAEEGFESFIAFSKGRLIGSAMVYHERGLHRSRILSIAVLPEMRGRSYGKELLAHLEQRAVHAGSTVMSLEVRVTNLSAINLYLHQGYKIEGTIKDYFGKGHDALYMERTLL